MATEIDKLANEIKDIYEEEDSDDVWFEVYNQCDFTPYCGNHEHLQAYKGFHYFECWGGGPQGGFITNDNNEIYEVNRTWGTPFTVERIFDKMEMEARGNVIHLRLRPWVWWVFKF